MDLEREEKGVRTLGSLRGMESGGIHILLWLHKYYKEAKLSFLQSSPAWPGYLFEDPAVLPLGSGALGRGQVLYWQMNTLGQIPESSEAWVPVVARAKPHYTSGKVCNGII